MRRTLGRKNSTKDIKAIRALSKITDFTIACRVYNNAAFTHNSTGNYLAITFNAERRDAFAMHSTITNTSRITIRVSGWYLVTGHAVFDGNATGIRRLALRVDGSTYIAATNHVAASASEGSYLTVSTLYYLAADSYVELMAYQNSGGSLDILASGNFTPELAVAKFPFTDNPKTEFVMPVVP